MAARQNWCVGREDAPEDFDELLRDTDSEDEGEAEYLLEEEPEEQEAEHDEPEYLDQEFLEPDPEIKPAACSALVIRTSPRVIIFFLLENHQILHSPGAE
ncbi:hypothetical protein PYW07_006459 [Mythimna separata]|uniref:Uncharacterized protein n=1 Tax=Mythimna separata TaxID=271217 RepID=A0AAD8DWS1_MYTSE|nr:hypothetical protein PYW07_006459 [Mythimna separata]